MERLGIILGIGIGGALGSTARYLVGLAVPNTAFPWATLLVNISGCLAMGALSAWFAAHAPGRETLRLAVLVGVLGGYTTFSSFGRETLDLIDRGRWVPALAYAGASGVLGVLAVWLGRRAVGGPGV